MKWLEDYLISHVNVTCLIVSHDSGYVECYHFDQWLGGSSEPLL